MTLRDLLLPALAACFLLLASCGRESPREMNRADSLRAINETMEYRRNADEFFKNDPASPFKAGDGVPYEGIRWFPPDPGYYFLTKLVRKEHPDTVTVLGTKGEPRKQLRIGYFPVTIGGTGYHLNVYKFTDEDIRIHPQLANVLSVWYTDATTGKETYGVGRYVEIEPENPDPDHLYVVNLNNSHNPYCAYNHAYSCAVPTAEDHLPVPVRAGELKYHADE
jgi:uncharacterized protein (DUF1684 family)